MLSVAASAFCAYTLAPGGYAATATRSGPLSMEEHRLNNYVLDGPLQPLGNQVRAAACCACALRALADDTPQTRARR